LPRYKVRVTKVSPKRRANEAMTRFKRLPSLNFSFFQSFLSAYGCDIIMSFPPDSGSVNDELKQLFEIKDTLCRNLTALDVANDYL
jgi:hypothetical protein